MSASQIVNLQTNSLFTQPIGQILKQAGLISSSQLNLALRDQSFHKQVLIGEIMALKGWVKIETVNFFVNCLPSLIQTKQQQPLGYYLKQAGLLSNNQVEYLLSLQTQRQQQGWIRLGKLAVINKLLKQETLDFFLGNICTKSYLDKVYLSDEY